MMQLEDELNYIRTRSVSLGQLHFPVELQGNVFLRYFCCCCWLSSSCISAIFRDKGEDIDMYEVTMNWLTKGIERLKFCYNEI